MTKNLFEEKGLETIEKPFIKRLAKRSIAQGTIEYLVIIAIVVIIALVVVGLITGIFSSTGYLTNTSSKIELISGNLALTDYSLTTDGNYILNLKLNQTAPITITSITMDGTTQNYSSNNKLFQASKKIFQINTSTTCTEGTTKNTTITINYTTELGLTKSEIISNVTIPCETTTINQNTTTATQTDTTTPTITLIAPEDNNLITSLDTNVNFIFQVSDASTITDCNLYLDEILQDTTSSVTKDTNITLDANLGTTGDHTWDINCTDSAGNKGTATDRNINYTPLEEEASCSDYATTDGEDIVDDGTYCIAVFLSSGTFTALTSFNAEVLVVGGGGGGGGPVHAGGGGAGGLDYNDSYPISPGEIEVVVGVGGAGGEGWNATTSPGKNGTDSIFGDINAIGGGGGAYWYEGASTAGIGGSGGGAAPEPEAATGAAGTEGQGYAGGGSYGSTNAGGGGGAGGAGVKAIVNKAGDGGVGLEFDINGSSVYYASGGGGGVHQDTANIGEGGLGGGGDGGGNTVGTANGLAGTANSGGGGGGAGGTSGSSYVGGAGGSGVVIIRYLK